MEKVTGWTNQQYESLDGAMPEMAAQNTLTYEQEVETIVCSWDVDWGAYTPEALYTSYRACERREWCELRGDDFTIVFTPEQLEVLNQFGWR